MFSDYIELMKIRIGVLLLLVAAAGYVVTAGPHIDPFTFSILMMSGLLASSGASAINCYFDRDVDAAMNRTRSRALPTGRIRPPEKALIFGLSLTFISLVLAALAINLLTAAFIVTGILVYVGIYTLGLKRRSPTNIVIGGAAGSFPALAGSSAAAGAVSVSAMFIAILVFLWTPGHFWLLAFCRREEYKTAKLPMLPAVLGEHGATLWITVSNVIVLAFAFIFLLLNTSAWLYLAVVILANTMLLRMTLRFLREPTKTRALSGYKFSGTYLTLLLVALIAQALVASLT